MEINAVLDVSSRIQKSLSDSQWYVRQTAAIACGYFNLKKSKTKLIKLSKTDTKKAVRVAAEKSLKQLG